MFSCSHGLATQRERQAHPDEGLAITYSCTMCSAHGPVDIEKLVRLKGPDYSLVNRRCPCRLKPGSTGWIRFFYSHGRMTPMWDDTMADRWSDHDWAIRMKVIDALGGADSERERKRRERQ